MFIPSELKQILKLHGKLVGPVKTILLSYKDSEINLSSHLDIKHLKHTRVTDAQPDGTSSRGCDAVAAPEANAERSTEHGHWPIASAQKILSNLARPLA